MKTIFRIAAASLMAMSLLSCNKFLDKYPTDKVSANTVFTSAEMAEAAVVGVYSNLLYDYVSAELPRLNWDAFAGILDAYYDNFYQNYLYMNGNIQPSHSSFLTYWKVLYEGINRANDAIAGLPSVPGMSEDLKARRIAECRFIRAYNYYKLNALWGGVPVYKENLAPSEYTKARSTQEEVWDFLIDELTECINCESLPDKVSSGEFGRISKGAAYALRGKVYMWKKDWANAEKDLKEVGKAGFKLLEKPYADVFKVANEACDEMVFSSRMVELSGLGNVFSRTYGSWQVAGGGGNNTFYMSRKFVDSYQCADGKAFNWDDFIPGYNDMTPEARSVYFLRDGMTESEKASMASYGADMSKYLPSGNEARIKAVFQARDPRLLATVITPYSTYSGGFYGSAANYTRTWPFRDDQAPQNDLKTKANNNYFYTIRKFVVVGMECLNNTFNPCDVPIIRYAQVLIDLAEAINEQGSRQDEAVSYLNMVRKRAGVAEYPSGGSITELRERIVNERRWELACEEVIYYDELRQGTWKDFRFSDGNGCSEPWGTNDYNVIWGGDAYNLWPIPSTEVEMNSNLEQNEGWTM